MFNLPAYLQKYKLLTSKQSANKEVILQVLKNFNFNFEPNQLEVKNKILKIKTKPIIKSELFLQKEEILSELTKKLGTEVINLQ